jgi:hypothetical protein
MSLRGSARIDCVIRSIPRLSRYLSCKAFLTSHIALGTEAAFSGTMPVTWGQLLFASVVIWFLALIISGVSGCADLRLWLPSADYDGGCGLCDTMVPQNSGLVFSLPPMWCQPCSESYIAEPDCASHIAYATCIYALEQTIAVVIFT